MEEGRAVSPLRIGIDGEALRTPLSGVGQYVLQLCRELETLWPDAQLFAYARLPADKLALPSARWTLRQEARAMLRRLPSFLWLKTRGAALCRRDRLDVFWAGRTLHPRLAAPVHTVCTVHDLNHLIVPDTMEAATLWSHRLWLRGDVARADCVLTNSQGTARRVACFLYGWDGSRSPSRKLRRWSRSRSSTCRQTSCAPRRGRFPGRERGSPSPIPPRSSSR
jgi:hypothetical protein